MLLQYEHWCTWTFEISQLTPREPRDLDLIYQENCILWCQCASEGKDQYKDVAAQMKDYPQYHLSANISYIFDKVTVLCTAVWGSNTTEWPSIL